MRLCSGRFQPCRAAQSCQRRLQREPRGGSKAQERRDGCLEADNRGGVELRAVVADVPDGARDGLHLRGGRRVAPRREPDQQLLDREFGGIDLLQAREVLADRLHEIERAP